LVFSPRQDHIATWPFLHYIWYVFFFFHGTSKVWISESCWHNMLQAASLYSIKSILILDSEGARIAAKYYTSGTA
jgi:hypothetical protein